MSSILVRMRVIPKSLHRDRWNTPKSSTERCTTSHSPHRESMPTKCWVIGSQERSHLTRPQIHARTWRGRRDNTVASELKKERPWTKRQRLRRKCAFKVHFIMKWCLLQTPRWIALMYNRTSLDQIHQAASQRLFSIYGSQSKTKHKPSTGTQWYLKQKPIMYRQ